MEEGHAVLAAAQHLAHSQEHWTRAGPFYLSHRSAFGDGPLSQRGFHLQQRFRFSRSLQQPAGLFHGQRIEDEDCRERRRSEEHTSELQSQSNLVCRLLLEKKKY